MPAHSGRRLPVVPAHHMPRGTITQTATCTTGEQSNICDNTLPRSCLQAAFIATFACRPMQWMFVGQASCTGNKRDGPAMHAHGTLLCNRFNALMQVPTCTLEQQHGLVHPVHNSYACCANASGSPMPEVGSVYLTPCCLSTLRTTASKAVLTTSSRLMSSPGAQHTHAQGIGWEGACSYRPSQAVTPHEGRTSHTERVGGGESRRGGEPGTRERAGTHGGATRRVRHAGGRRWWGANERSEPGGMTTGRLAWRNNQQLTSLVVVQLQPHGHCDRVYAYKHRYRAYYLRTTTTLE